MGAVIVDPEFEALVPPLSIDEREQLRRNLLSDGCRDPLVTWGDVLIDGHNRFSICCEYGVEFETVECLTVHSRDDAILWIVNNQLGRRNITDFVRVELALRAKPIIEARAKANQVAAGGSVRLKSDEPVRTDVAVAQAAGVGKDTVRKVERVLASGTAETIDKARSGVVSINKAAKAASVSANQQAAVIGQAPAARATPEQIAEDAHGDVDLLGELETLQRENDRLHADLAAAEAVDHKAEVLKWRRAHQVAERRQGELMDTAHHAQKHTQFLKNQLARCGRAVGESDPDKIAPAVEAFVRENNRAPA